MIEELANGPTRKRVKSIMKETFTRRRDWMIEQPSVEMLFDDVCK